MATQELFDLLYPGFQKAYDRQSAYIRSHPEEYMSAPSYVANEPPASVLDIPKRWAVAGIVRPAGEVVSSILDFPAFLGAHVPLPWPGGLPEPGTATKAWDEYTQKLGGLKGTTMEKILQYLGTGLSYGVPWATAAKGLAMGSRALGAATKAAGMANTAERLGGLARVIEAPQGVAQWAAREGAIASALYPVLEAPKSPEADLNPASLAEYAGTAAIGSAASALLGKLARAAMKNRSDVLASLKETTTPGQEAPLPGVPETDASKVDATKLFVAAEGTKPTGKGVLADAVAGIHAGEPVGSAAAANIKQLVRGEGLSSLPAIPPVTPPEVLPGSGDLITRATIMRDYWAAHASKLSEKVPPPKAGETPGPSPAFSRAVNNAAAIDALLQDTTLPENAAKLEAIWAKMWSNPKVRPKLVELGYKPQEAVPVGSTEAVTKVTPGVGQETPIVATHEVPAKAPTAAIAFPDGVNTVTLTDVEKDLLAKAGALHERWSRTYRNTDQGLTLKSGEKKRFTDINNTRADQRRQRVDEIAQAIVAKRATPEMAKELNTEWAKQLRSKDRSIRSAAVEDYRAYLERYRNTQPAQEAALAGIMHNLVGDVGDQPVERTQGLPTGEPVQVVKATPANPRTPDSVQPEAPVVADSREVFYKEHQPLVDKQLKSVHTEASNIVKQRWSDVVRTLETLGVSRDDPRIHPDDLARISPIDWPVNPAWQEAKILHVLGRLYKLADKTGQHGWALKELAQRGILDSEENWAPLLRGIATRFHQLLGANIVRDLDDIFLNPKVTTKDLLKAYKTNGLKGLESLNHSLAVTKTAPPVQEAATVTAPARTATVGEPEPSIPAVKATSVKGASTREMPKLVPGSPAWREALREATGVDRENLTLDAAAHWDHLAASFAEQLPKGAPKIVYVDEIRGLPELTKHDVPYSVVAKELLKRGFTIGDPVDRILDNLKVAQGSKVEVKVLEDLPSVKSKDIALKVLVKAIRERGGEVVGGEIEMNAGIPLKQALDRIRMQRAGNTRPTFTPIDQITLANRSLPLEKIRLLPDELVKGDGRLGAIDRDAAIKNHHIKRLILDEGHPAEMTPEARAKYDKLMQDLAKIDAKRDLLRPYIEAKLGDIKKQKYSASALNALNRGSLIEGAVPILDADGRVIEYAWASPLKGTRVSVAAASTITKMDENIWRNQPGFLASILEPMRFALGEPVVRPLRNAFRVTQVFESEFEDALYKILKPIIKSPDSLDRVTLILEGKTPKNATKVEYQVAGGLRSWYNRLFKEFDIKPERFLKDYAPRIRQYGSIREAFSGKPPKELTFFAELERTAKGIVFPTETNALTSALTYLRLGTRKKFIQPALRAIDPLRVHMHADNQRILDELINNVLHRPVWEERLLNSTVSKSVEALGISLGPEKNHLAGNLSQLATYLIYQATLGANPITVLKNLTQVMLSIGTLDPNPAKGVTYFSKALHDLFTKNGRVLLKHCWVYQHRVFLEGMERQANLLGRIYRPVEKVTMWPFEMSDRLNVSLSYLMKLHESLDKKLPLSEAVDAANMFAADTQFLYGIDSPMLYKSPVGKVLGVLMSWPVNFLSLMKQQWVNGGTAGKVKIVSTIVGMAALQHMLKYTGLDFSSESPVNVAKGWLPLALLSGGETTSIPVRTVSDAVKLANAAFTGTAADRDKAWEQLRQDLWNYVPLSVEGRRVLKAIQAFENGGYTYSDKAGIPYRKYRMTNGEIIRSIIGPTTESKERSTQFTEQATAKDSYNYFRDKAVEAYMKGDKDKLHYYQEKIKQMGGNPVTVSDIQRRKQEAQKSALERQAEGLPRKYQPPDLSTGQQILRFIMNTLR